MDARSHPMARAQDDARRREFQSVGRRTAGARIYVRERAWTRPERRGAKPGAVPSQQPGTPSADRRQDRTLVEDRQHQLLQGLYGDAGMKACIISIVIAATGALAFAQSPNTAS